MAEDKAVASVFSKGDLYDNAMAEALSSLYKAELIRNRGPWTGIDELRGRTPKNLLTGPPPEEWVVSMDTSEVMWLSWRLGW